MKAPISSTGGLGSPYCMRAQGHISVKTMYGISCLCSYGSCGPCLGQSARKLWPLWIPICPTPVPHLKSLTSSCDTSIFYCTPRGHIFPTNVVAFYTKGGKQSRKAICRRLLDSITVKEGTAAYSCVAWQTARTEATYYTINITTALAQIKLVKILKVGSTNQTEIGTLHHKTK